MTRYLSPQKAAKRAGVGRTTIVRALSSSELRAFRDNLGRWKIEPEAIDDWLSMRAERSGDGQSPELTPFADDTSQYRTMVRSEVAVLEAEKRGLEARLADTQAERDRLAEALSKALEARRGVFAKLFDRFT